MILYKPNDSKDEPTVVLRGNCNGHHYTGLMT